MTKTKIVMTGNYNNHNGEDKMYNLQISQETADQLIKDALISDYRRVRDEVAALKSGILRPFEVEDLLNSTKWLKAFETILTYYLVESEYLALILEDPNDIDGCEEEEDEYVEDEQ